LGQSNTVVHDFKKELAFSEKASHEPFWQAVYKKAFPDMVWNQLCPGKIQGQYLGIDRVVYLRSGKTLNIDEKKRKKDRNDFFLEYESKGPKYQAIGWMEKDLQIDYLAYAFMPSKRCYILPWQLLRKVWIEHKNEWFKKYEKKPGKNDGYDTWGLCVPIFAVTSRIKEGLFIQI
jgi:hypothetical protein